MCLRQAQIENVYITGKVLAGWLRHATILRKKQTSYYSYVEEPL